MRFAIPCFLTSIILSLLQGAAHAEEVADIKPLIEAAATFIDSLDEAQKTAALLEFKNPEREDWHYVPKKRKGLAWRDMSEEQKTLSWAPFSIALSESGASKTRSIIALEEYLWELSDRSDYRDPEKYHVTIFGQPAPGATWGASLEGHHLSVNLTVIEGREVFVTPSFFGANPDRLTEGDRTGFRPLKGEAEEAIKLLKMLNPEQRKRAVLKNKAPREIITRAKREVSSFPEEGLPASEMSEEQCSQLRKILNEYIGRYRAQYVSDDWEKIEAAGIENIYFSWAGSELAGEPMYYRLQGPTFIMEYVNVQNGGNHSHTVWRDFENDFGRDLLKEHLDHSH